jgi:DNA-binding response OmpR family regulator
VPLDADRSDVSTDPGTKRVLLIEDTAILRRLIEVAVTPLGVELIARSDGKTGLDAVFVEEPDLVMLDIGVPVLDGWAVLEAIRDVGPTPPVLVVTARGGSKDEQRARELGANGFISKPFRPDDLLMAAEQLLAGASTV